MNLSLLRLFPGTGLVTMRIKLDTDLLSILLTENFDNFTVLELRSAYLAINSNSKLGKVDARKYVYRNILRLEKKGLLERKYSTKRDRTYYSKSQTFSPDVFQETGMPKEIKSTESTNLDGEGFKKDLIGRLNQYKSELLCSIGETEEYKTLCTQFPELSDDLQQRYNKARDYSSKVLGRIKALESIISQNIINEYQNEAP